MIRFDIVLVTDYHFFGIKIHKFFEMNSFRIIFRKAGKPFAMVSIIELDKGDGDRVQGLSVEKTKGAESLFNEINGPRSFQHMWVVNILTGMQTKITSVNVGFDRNWLSIFIRLGPKGRKHMLISMETRKVKWKHRSSLSRYIKRLTIRNNLCSDRHAGHREYEGACDGLLPR